MSTAKKSALTLQQALAAATQTRRLEIGTGILANAEPVFREQFGNREAVVVADAITFSLAAEPIQQSFKHANHPLLAPFVFKAEGLSAEHEFVSQLERALREHQAIPIAVGAGAINDLVKLAAHRTERPYVCVATAASMDGYTAYGSSISYQGSKQTFACPAPRIVLADLEIIAAAPASMTAAGYADLLAKVTAGADWILADALGVEPIQTEPWQIAQGRLKEFVSDPAGVAAGKPEAIAKLVEGLMLSGFAMQAAESSRPASGAEHQFSHLWDMQHHTHDGVAPSHGFKVGIGTLAVTALYERLLREPGEQLDVDACCREWPTEAEWRRRIEERFSGSELRNLAQQETGAKNVSAEWLRKQLNELRNQWPALKKRLGEQLIPFDQLKQMLSTAKAPVEPEAIGITRARLKESVWQAYHIRRRFTVLDAIARIGLLDHYLEEIFGPSGRWPSPSNAQIAPP